MPTGQTEPDQALTIFQWRDEPGTEDSYCYHVARRGAGYQIINPANPVPIATIKRFEPMPGQFKFWGKVWEWNNLSQAMIVHNYEFSTAKNCRSYLNTIIRQTFTGDCEIVGKAAGRPKGVGAREARNKRDRARRRAQLRAERFAHIAELVARQSEPLPAGLSHDQVIDWLLDRLPE